MTAVVGDLDERRGGARFDDRSDGSRGPAAQLRQEFDDLGLGMSRVKHESRLARGGFRSSGGGIRTRDLRVMSPTSYQTAPPRGVDVTA